MSKNTTKNFIKGSAKQVTFGDGGTIINLSLNLDELNELPHPTGYVQLSVMERREADTYGNTHYVVENTYKPKGGDKPEPKAGKPVKTVKDLPESDDDDLPF